MSWFGRIAASLLLVGPWSAVVGTVPPQGRRAPVEAAATGTLLRDGSGLYPRAVRLQHSGSANGRILASVVTFSRQDGVGAIYESTDGGVTFAVVGTVADGQAADGRGMCCATLFELPRQIGALPAGTLLWAASVRANARPMAIRVWRSADVGRTWSYLSSCVVAANTGGLWEPEFSIAADGRLVCHYADETDAAHSQKLAEVRSSDGVTWTDRRDTVASPTRAHRPGMPVVRRLPNGSYLMAYEICGTGCAVHVRSSSDGWNWGDPSTTGHRPQTMHGNYFTHTPTIAWAPDRGNDKGKILLIGQIYHRPDGTASAFNGRTILANAERGGGYWYEIPAPVAVADPYDNFCPNYSSPLVPSADGDRVLELATDYDGEVCKTYYASGSAIGTGTPAGVVSGQTYRLRGVQGGHCLDVERDSRVNGGNVQHWTCHGDGNQDWLVTSVDAGHFTLRGRNSALCLEVAGRSAAPGANVQQYACHGGTNQDWRIVNVGRGYYQLINRNSGLCLDIAGGSTASGANVQQWTCNNLHPQIWYVQRRDTVEPGADG